MISSIINPSPLYICFGDDITVTMTTQERKRNGRGSRNPTPENEVRKAYIDVDCYDSIRMIRILARGTSGEEWTELKNKVKELLE